MKDMKLKIKNIFFAVIIVTTFFGSASVNAQNYVDQRSAIPFSFKIEANMFPSSWVGGRIQGQATPINKSEIERSFRLLKQAMSQYPVEVLKKNLKKIYVFASMKFYGVAYGGTNSTDVLYFTNRGVKAGFTDQYIIRSFHHEFSSILLRNFPKYIDQKQWLKQNPKGFQYGGTGADAIRNKQANTSIQDTYLKMGFLSQYATSNFENDLNLVAEQLFYPQEDFSETLYKYPNVRKKVELAIDFYGKIHPQFDFEFFGIEE